MEKEIHKTARIYKDVKVEFSRNPHYISIDKGSKSIMFAQDEDAEMFENEINNITNHFNVTDKEALLWHLDSAGAISRSLIKEIMNR